MGGSAILRVKVSLAGSVRFGCLILLLAVVFSGCSRSDPIDRLMTEIPHEFTPSYPYRPIQLPETATPEQLISALAERGTQDLGHFDFTGYKILETRKTHTKLGPNDEQFIENYIAVLLDTRLGQKIVVFKPQNRNGTWSGWYYKTYDAR
jgi:hypothetical protein